MDDVRFNRVCGALFFCLFLIGFGCSHDKQHSVHVGYKIKFLPPQNELSRFEHRGAGEKIAISSNINSMAEEMKALELLRAEERKEHEALQRTLTQEREEKEKMETHYRNKLGNYQQQMKRVHDSLKEMMKPDNGK